MFRNADSDKHKPWYSWSLANGTKEKFARAVSNIAQAPVMSIPAFILINYFFLDLNQFIIITAICLMFAAVLPTLVVLLWSRNKNHDRDLPQKEDRFVPLLIVIALYLTGAVVLYLSGAPVLSTGLMFCYFSNTLLVLFINIFWKISIHSMGVAGPTTALIIAFGAPGAILGLLLPLVMWSRVYQKRHTIAQVIMGAFMGFALTAGQLYVAYTYLGMDVDVNLLLWLIYAFVGPAIVLGTSGILNNMGVRDGYTRKIFHFLGFASIAVFLRYAPPSAAATFIVLGIIYVGIACFSGSGFVWYDGIRRRSDAPNETLYVIMPMVSTVIGLAACWALFGHPAVEIGMLCVAIGDALAEPIGVRFGKHKYKVFSLIGKPSERSIEGSLVVMLSCSALIFAFTRSPVLSLALGTVVAIVEAFSPRGTDNFTVFLTASAGIIIGSALGL